MRKRKGASKGPDSLRAASNYFEFFERDGNTIPICPMSGTLENKSILDFGNVARDDLYRLIFDIVSAKKVPITIGGDHSITTLILNGIYDALESNKDTLFCTSMHIRISFLQQGTIMGRSLQIRQSLSTLQKVCS